MNDLGSGALVDVTQYSLPYEPTVQETVKAGVDVAMVSGDKLLGGPQCGILVGKSEHLARMAAHPLYRALRADKMTLAALEATLRLYLDSERLTKSLPVLSMLSQTREQIARRARRLRTALAKLPGLTVRLVDGDSYTGGGGIADRAAADETGSGAFVRAVRGAACRAPASPRPANHGDADGRLVRA